jgi:hypothetical protein
MYRALLGAGFFVSRRPTEDDERDRTYGRGTGEVLQQLWAGVTSGRPFLLELRQTGSPHGARTYTGSRCSCPPAPTSPKKCPAAASGRSSEYSEQWKA